MEFDPSSRPAPSRGTLFAVLGGGLAVAGLLLTCIVLPAEYGIDPLGTGRALGLTGLAQVSSENAARSGASAPVPASAPTEASAPATVAGPIISPVLQPEPVASRWGEAASVTGAFIPRSGSFHLDSREITLQPFEGMEIKYHMPEGAGLVYSWTASAPVLYDFHGEPDVAPPGAPVTDDDYFESYDHEDVSGKSEFHGTLVAPRTGIQGWFWENSSADVVKIKLVAAGFFDWVYQNRDEQKTKLKPLSVDSLATHPQVPDEPL
jgi:hypothetical protein